jgi:hypothetical protein
MNVRFSGAKTAERMGGSSVSRPYEWGKIRVERFITHYRRP